jgi:hypothetical protein
VYVYAKPSTGWANATQTAKLTYSAGATNDLLGISVAISSDGSTVAGGAAYAMVGGSYYQKAVHVFSKPSTGWANATQTATLTPSDAAYGGFPLAISSDGSTVAAGDPGVGVNQGAVYVYAKPSTGWANATQTAKLTASDSAWLDQLGYSVAMSSDGRTVVAGAIGATVGGNSDQGAVYVYAKPSTGWANATQTAKLTASDGAAGDELGTSVAMSSDGRTVVAGASGASSDRGAVYVFGPQPSITLTPPSDQTATEGMSQSFALGSFSDSDSTLPSSWQVQVNWGDNTSNTYTATQTGTLTAESHLYAEELSYSVTVTVTDLSDYSSATQTFGVSVDDPPVSAAASTGFSATEGTMSNTRTLATFTDPGGAEALSDYTVDVDWGNGTFVSGDTNVSISGPDTSGVFTVSGKHLYTDEDGYTGPVRIRINHEASSPSPVVSVPLSLTDPPVVATAATGPFVATEGTLSAVQTLTTFTDPGGAEALSDYTVDVDWGNGSFVSGDANLSISGPNTSGVFTVSGKHLYTDEDGYTGPVRIRINHEASGPSPVVSVSLSLTDPPVVATAATGPFSATEGTGSAVQTLATFTDPAGAEALSDYTVDVDWGNGSFVSGDANLSISGPNTSGVFTVSGKHLYADEDGYTGAVQIRINHEASSPSAVVSVPLSLTDPAVVATAATGPFSATEGTLSGVQTLATFTDPAGAQGSSDYTVDVDWGNGTFVSGDANVSISGPDASGVFTVSGKHLYTDEDGYSGPVQIRINHEASSPSPVVSVPLSLTDPAVQATAATGPFVATEGTLSAVQTLTTFTDPGGAEALSDYTVDVDWGNGTFVSGDPNVSISGPDASGVFTVSGKHLYADEDGYTGAVRIRINHEASSPSPVVSVSLSLSDLAVVATAATGPFSATEGTLSGVQTLATFTDPAGSEALSDYTVDVDWGNGTFVSGDPNVSISGPDASGVFTVSGKHLYADEDGYTGPVEIRINHEASSPSPVVSVSLSLTDPAVVATAATGPFSATEGTLSAVRTLATFTDPGGAEALSDYTVDVDWGNGTFVSGDADVSISGPGGGGVLTVSGKHLYADEDGYAGPVRIRINHEASSPSPVVSVPLSLTDPAVMATGGSTLKTVVGATPAGSISAVSVPVATFQDPGGAETNSSAHYTATISWGDGSPNSSGTISFSGSLGSPTAVFTVSAGPHPYAAQKTYTLTVTINHEGVLSTVTDTVTVGPPPPALSQGYWQNHSAWPVGALTMDGFSYNGTGSASTTMITLGGIAYTESQLLTVMQASTGGNALLILADQLIAAVLNVANGAAHSANTDSTIADANSLLNNYNLYTAATKRSPNVNTSSTLGAKMVKDANYLAGYDNGQYP